MNDFDRNMLFFCGCCEKEHGEHSIQLKCSSSFEGLYKHWKNEHKRFDMKPFRFYMAEFVACNCCYVMNTFDGLKSHVMNAHPSETFFANPIAKRTYINMRANFLNPV